ncbi:MAG: hypothetical protein RBQ97_02960 [Acholeplasma sp.]|nr:hypothetical protein [Acholeplasma sp.]
MIKLLINHLLSMKNKIVISIFVLLLTLIFIVPLPHDTRNFEIFYFKDVYQEYYYTLLYRLLNLIFPIVSLVVASDHDQDYLNNLTTYLGRFKVITSKVLTYVLLISITYVVILLLHPVILVASKNTLIYQDLAFDNIFSTYLNSLIILMFTLLLIRKKSKYLSYMLIIIYFLSDFYFAQFDSITLINYIIPFAKEVPFTYKIAYILFIFELNVLRYLYEDL